MIITNLKAEIDNFITEQITALKSGAITIKPIPCNCGDNYAKKDTKTTKTFQKSKSKTNFKNSKANFKARKNS